MGDNQISLVALGGYAGGVEVIARFFLALPADTGIAYFVIAHLMPNQISILPELRQRKIKMKGV